MRKEESRFTDSVIFEGMTSIRACLSAYTSSFNDRRILQIWYDKARSTAKAKELGYLRAMSTQYGFSLTPADEAFLDEITVGNSHGGFVAECSSRTMTALNDACVTLSDSGFYVMIEGIEDPYNFGYAIRSIYTCGADGIILSPRNWMSAAGVVCRSSAGASELLPLFVADGCDAVKIFREKGYKVLCAGIRDSVSSFDCDMSKPLFLIVGGEKRGISRKLLDMADTVVRIDYGREFAGSLSAASAASMLAYEVLRQNRK